MPGSPPGGHSAHKPTGGLALFLGGKILSLRYFLVVIQMPGIFLGTLHIPGIFAGIQVFFWVIEQDSLEFPHINVKYR